MSCGRVEGQENLGISKKGWNQVEIYLIECVIKFPFEWGVNHLYSMYGWWIIDENVMCDVIDWANGLLGQVLKCKARKILPIYSSSTQGWENIAKRQKRGSVGPQIFGVYVRFNAMTSFFILISDVATSRPIYCSRDFFWTPVWYTLSMPVETSFRLSTNQWCGNVETGVKWNKQPNKNLLKT